MASNRASGAPKSAVSVSVDDETNEDDLLPDEQLDSVNRKIATDSKLLRKSVTSSYGVDDALRRPKVKVKRMT